MEIDANELDAGMVGSRQFLLGHDRKTGCGVWFSDLGKGGNGNHLWLVVETGIPGHARVHQYSTEEMKILYKSARDQEGQLIRADEKAVRRLLIRMGEARMKLTEGCPACRQFWDEDGSEGQCSKCRRCYNCCGKEYVPYTCGAVKAHQQAKAGRNRYKRVRR